MQHTRELREGAVVLDDEIGAGPLQFRRHLRGDHVHGFGFAKAAFLDEALETNGAMCVDEENAVEAVGHVPLEKERNVADDDPVSSPLCLIDEPRTETLDFGMDDLVKFFELRVIGEDHAPERGSVE